jgi:hypothetical protein
MNTTFLAALTAAVLLSAAAPALSGPDAFVAGQKLDTGLGELPHYSKWADPTGRNAARVSVAGESLDDGLGELPHYSKWANRSGTLHSAAPLHSGATSR